MSDKSSQDGIRTGWMRELRVNERRAFDRVVFRIGGELSLPDGSKVPGEIVNVSLVGLLFTPAVPVSYRGEAFLDIPGEVSNLKIGIVDTSDVGLHLETLPHDTDIRDLALKYPAIARLFLPYIYQYDSED
ncbi:hypothetical protein [Nisaea sediminum]|uniref:hypothetical protein n=1 Tax=Nisaea sediminum TaxID=2775867 RepID=UPI001868B89E|nr:hypothetical protein [Nisaea sediminum]